MRQTTLPVLICVLIGLGATLLAAPGNAQTPDERVLSTWLEPVKLADGTETEQRHEIVYDYRTNEARLTVFDAADRVVETKATAAPAVPHPDEQAEALALIYADPELASVIESMDEPMVHGGYILYEDECQNLRCLQFTIDSADASRLERFVVVELSTQTILERDLHPDLRD